MVVWADTLLQGVLVGGLYALFAISLSLAFGVMRLVNLAHGDLIVMAAFMALMGAEAFGLAPLSTLVAVVPAMAALGYALQRGLINPVLGGDALRPLLVTFGLSLVLQNGMQEAFSADTRRLQLGALETASLDLSPGLALGWYPLLVMGAAISVTVGLQLLLYRTRFGAALRATSDDGETALLMGVSGRHICGMAAALGLGIAGLAGVLMGGWTSFDPAAGPARLIYAFEAVIIGGLGSPWGTLAGGVVLGVAQAVGGAFDPAWQVLAGHLVFLAVLLVAPRGLFPRMAD
jgi:branched-chain amino acid transport system permease protein